MGHKFLVDIYFCCSNATVCDYKKNRDKYKFDTGVSNYTIFYLLVWPGAMEHFPSSSLKIFAICIYTHNIFCGISQKLLFLDTFYISFILFRTIVQ